MPPSNHELTIPAYLHGQEKGSVHKNHNAVDFRLAMGFPDHYSIGAASPALNIFYQLLNKDDAVVCERFFLPGDGLAKSLQESQTPLFAIESRKPLRDFDMLGFSVNNEFAYLNVLKILELAQIPLLTENRSKYDPFITCGGAISLNPAPLADFVDFFFLGESEYLIQEIIYLLIRKKDLDRKEKLQLIANHEHIYVPAIHGRNKKIKRDITKDLSVQATLNNPLIPYGTEANPILPIQVIRGCAQKCRYCPAGYTNLPVRSYPLEEIEKAIERSQIKTIALLAPNITDYPELDILMDEINAKYKDHTFLLPTLKVQNIHSSQLHNLHPGVYWLSLEAGTERLRSVLNRPLSHKKEEETILKLIKLKPTRVYIDFMIGLPTETAEDISAIVQRSNNIYHLLHGITKITISINPFIPKPHTPFQWHKQASQDYMKQTIEYLKIHLALPDVEFQYGNPEKATIEGLLARGNYDLTGLLQQLIYDHPEIYNWSKQYHLRTWEKTATKLGINLPDLLSRTYGLADPLPWDNIDTGVSKSYLQTEYRLALSGKTTRSCMVGCKRCGVCL